MKRNSEITQSLETLEEEWFDLTEKLEEFS